jgi:hypothetical protein
MSDLNDDTSHYEGALLEDMDRKLDIILEVQAGMSSVPERLTNLEASMDEVKADVKVIKSALKHQTKEFRTRLTALEPAK